MSGRQRFCAARVGADFDAGFFAEAARGCATRAGFAVFGGGSGLAIRGGADPRVSQ